MIGFYEEFIGKGNIKLTRGEVSTLVNLIACTGETDAEAMGLKDADEALYDKLKKQCQKIANLTGELVYLKQGFELGYDHYHNNPYEVLEQCEQDGTYEFTCDEHVLHLYGFEDLDVEAIIEAKREEGDFGYGESDLAYEINELNELKKKLISQAKLDYFRCWVDQQIENLEGKELHDFYCNVVGVKLDLDDCPIPDADIVIPDEIIHMAQDVNY